MNLLKLIFPLCMLFFTASTFADDEDEKDFSMMQELSDRGWHDLKNESWNLYGQGTYISSFKDRFNAPYTNLNGTTQSLTPAAKHSFSATFSMYLGAKAWDGGEFYVVGEMISMLPFSGLKGLGAGIQNFELQKNGPMEPLWYLNRAFFRQTIDLGGESLEIASSPMQLGKTTESRRFIFTVGTLSILDIFNKTSYTADGRKQFNSMAFMADGAYDFSADARGYTTGIAGELYWDDWTFRFGRFFVPKQANGLQLDYVLNRYGDQMELEHRHLILDKPGTVRLLAYRNHEKMGGWNEAITAYQLDQSKNSTTCTSYNYENQNETAPDLCWARRPKNKIGIGIGLEQELTDDIGVFARGMYSDGKTEVYSYVSADRSIMLGTAIKGHRWGRSKDSIGIGYEQSWISDAHAKYLNMGGVDGFIGDGKINVRAERVAEVYYQLHAYTSTFLTFDYQRIENPAYNADRGGFNVYGVRAHFEF